MMKKNTLESVFSYLSERAMNIAKYSDKLRENVATIESFISEISKKSGVYYTENLKEVTTAEDECYGVQKYDVINATDESALFGYKKVFDGNETTDPVYTSQQDRETLKLAVKQLPDFLSAYAEELKNANAEIVDLAEKAEKIAEYAKKVMKQKE